jgi:protein O-mannosyl-transferase
MGQKNKGRPEKKTSVPLQQKAGFFTRNSFQITLFLLAFVVFGNGIWNEYALDDEFYTAGANKQTQMGIRGIPTIFSSLTFYNADGSGYSYRPVTLTSFAIEIALFGEKPHVSHFINVLLYALTLVALFGLLRKWFVAQGDWFTFFVCLLFLVHPLHTEVVDNIKCRDEILALLLLILGFTFVWKHIETGKTYLLFLGPLFFLLALLAKRTAVPFMAILPLSLWFFGNISPKRILIYSGSFFLVILMVILIHRTMLPQETRTYQIFENPIHALASLPDRFATAFYIVGRYLWLHIIPHPLVYYYGVRYVEVVSWSNPIAIGSLVLHSVLVWLTYREFKKRSVLGYGLLVYLIFIATFSNLLRPAPGLMAERFTYASSLGFCICLVWFVFYVFKLATQNFSWKSTESYKVKLVLISVAALFTLRCWIRNTDWENKQTLYGNDMQHLHESAKANMLYGALVSVDAMKLHLEATNMKKQGYDQQSKQKEAESRRLFVDARQYYRQATVIAPYYHTAWGNLGTTYFFTDINDTALSLFLRSVKENPKYTEGHFNVGMAYDKGGNKDSAIFYFRKSISVDSSYVSSYEQLARITLKQDSNFVGAIDLLKLAAQNNPDSEVPWNNMAAMYMEQKDTATAAVMMEQSARINPSNLQRLYNIAMYYGRHGNQIKYGEYMGLYNAEKKKQEKKNPEMKNQRAAPAPR